MMSRNGKNKTKLSIDVPVFRIGICIDGAQPTLPVAHLVTSSLAGRGPHQTGTVRLTRSARLGPALQARLYPRCNRRAAVRRIQ
jgi:hypothetical protein